MFVSLLAAAGCRSTSNDPIQVTFPADVVVNPLPGSLTFFAFGDWGVYGLGDQSVVADRMNRYAQFIQPAFVTLLGDNFYPAGVASTSDAHWKQSFENVYKGAYLPKSFYAVLGNHDYQQNPQAEIDYGKQNGRWLMPDRYYTRVYPIDATTNLRIIYLDTSPFVEEYRSNPGAYPNLPTQNTARQVAWLDSVLNQARERWTIVIGHHPLYSVGKDHGGQPELVQQIQPLLAHYKVPLYLGGHSHTLQHLRPTGSVTDYIVAGGGGAPLGPTPTSDPTALFAQNVFGFAIVSANADELQVSFVDERGTLLYQFQR